MPTVYDVDINALNDRMSVELRKKDEMQAPEWARFVKTGIHKERPPQNPDWWQNRCAALLISIYRMGPIGVNKLRRKYGGKQRRGHKPAHFALGSGAIIRKALQQLEKAGLIKSTEKAGHKGRCVTAEGQSFVDKLAGKGYVKLGVPEVVHETKKEKSEEQGESKDITTSSESPSVTQSVAKEDEIVEGTSQATQEESKQEEAPKEK